MKTFAILALLTSLLSCTNANKQNNQETPASTSTTQAGQQKVVLPAPATDFVSQYFNNTTIKTVKEKMSPTPSGTFFEVKLANDIEIDFGEQGNWKEVNADGKTKLPTSFFPQAIQTYLNTNYPAIEVESIDMEANGYELELVNDINLFFDAEGVFLRQTD